jgi:tripartite-type tricarboxylate transporter receptor subunit TctC
MARGLAERLTLALGQPVVIDNKPGAGGNIGLDALAKSAGDGYTIGLGTSSLSINPYLYRKVPYDPVNDFTPINLTYALPHALVVQVDSPLKTVADLVRVLKAEPGKYNYASGGNGSGAHLCAELFKSMAGVDAVHVPYKGPAPAMTDMLGGRLDMVMTSSAASLVAAGKVRILAATSEKRVSVYPDVPTLAEVAPGVQAVSWVGMSVPASTPAAITQRLEREILSLLSEPTMRARLSDPAYGMTLMPLGSEKFLEFIQNELKLWAPVIKAGNIQIT